MADTKQKGVKPESKTRDDLEGMTTERLLLELVFQLRRIADQGETTQKEIVVIATQLEEIKTILDSKGI